MTKSELIAQLRKSTNAGILDCSKALQASNNDIEKAIAWLREKGIAKAGKLADRSSNEGNVFVAHNDKRVALIELNCETDFVERNESFKNLLKEITNLIIESNAKNLDEVLNLSIKNISLKQYILENSAQTGENIVLSKVDIYDLKEDEIVGIYNHTNNNRYATYIVLKNTTDKELAKNLALHICASQPSFINMSSIDADYLKNEKQIYLTLTQKENPDKSAEMIEKIAEGKLQKALSQLCLENQAYAVDPSIKIKDMLKNAQVVKFGLFLIKK